MIRTHELLVLVTLPLELLDEPLLELLEPLELERE